MCRNKGFTLIEAVIALAVFTVVVAGTMRVWQYTSHHAIKMLANADAFENARVSMDALLMNIQLADEITLKTKADDTLVRLTLRELDPDGKPHDYIFYYDSEAPPETAKYRRLEFGKDDEFASGIKDLKFTRDDDLFYITIISDGPDVPPLQCVADIRNKIIHE